MRKLVIALVLAGLLVMATVGPAFAFDGSARSGGFDGDINPGTAGILPGDCEGGIIVAGFHEGGAASEACP